jgi:hypothetical protein
MTKTVTVTKVVTMTKTVIVTDAVARTKCQRQENFKTVTESQRLCP